MVTVDAAAAIAANEAQIKAIKDLTKRARQKLANAVREEVDTHAYVNRTEDAQLSTRCIDNSDADHVDVTAGMGVQYAEVLNRRGFSDFIKYMELALMDIERDVNSFAS